MVASILLGIGYQVVSLIALPGIVVYLAIRAYKKKPVFGNVAHRLGFIPRAPKSSSVVWFHAVSVGETLLLESLINTLKQTRPDLYVYVTSGTQAGYTMAQKHLAADAHSFIPFDFLIPMYVAFKRIRPRSLVVVEAELWPNLFLLTSWFNTSLYLLNARLRHNSLFVRSHFGRLILRTLLGHANHIYAQQGERAPYESVGVSPRSITELGNVKIYNVIHKQDNHTPFTHVLKNDNDLILLVGSIHPGELPIYLRVFETLRARYPHIKLILAPRHFHWLSSLKEQVRNYSYTTWDASTKKYEFDARTHDILIVAQIGILFDLYRHADIFCLGGTFVPVGGHNLLEPAVWKNPIIIGPEDHMTRHIATQLEEHHALQRVTTEQQLLTTLDTLVTSPHKRIAMGTNAYRWVCDEYQHTARVIDEVINKL